MLSVDKKFGKYANPEVERRFLVSRVPAAASFQSEITDHYIINSGLRLRKAETKHGVHYKLGQKIRPDPKDTRLILHTNIYLSESEYSLLRSLPSREISKTRLSIGLGEDTMSIDQFHGQLEGLVLGEVDFGADGVPGSLVVPSFALLEVTDDERFTGGALASTSQAALTKLLAELSKS